MAMKKYLKNPNAACEDMCLNKEDVLEMNRQPCKMNDVVKFIKNTFPEVIKKVQKREIDYMGVLEYLANNQEIPYSNPDNSELSEAERKRCVEVKKRGQAVVKELQEIAKQCSERYGLDKCESIKWLDGSNTKTKKYLWLQMKYKDFEAEPISVSLFVEKNENMVRYRISLEIKNEGIDKITMDRYHSHLEVPKENKVEYVSGSNEWGNPQIITDSVEEIKRKILSGKIRKVQPSIYVEPSSEKTNEQYGKEVLEAIGRILPYYEYVIGKRKEILVLGDIEESVLNDEKGKERNSKIVYDKNMILYGPPGTGKTYHTAIYAVAICEKLEVDEVKKWNYNDVMEKYKEFVSSGQVVFTTFHQSYGYEEFIEGIKPVLAQSNVKYEIESGVFKKFCDEARKGDFAEKNYVFVIDEINRGNISKIFGELITLIEDTKREGMIEQVSVVLPYSKAPFSVPKNVYILGTMNTADRSIALMDTALRRRFRFIEMMPDAEVLVNIKADKVEDLDVARMLNKINDRITFLFDREHTIGHAFFTKLAESNNIETLGAIFEKAVIPLLQEYFYEDYYKIQLVLGDNKKSSDDIKFIIDEKVEVKDLFKQNTEDIMDLPERKYRINKEAFDNIESYREII